MSQNNQVDEDRAIITSAMGRGPIATLGAYIRLSGPGWLQSAITLGGGSLAGALFLGILGGTSMLWLQLVAIIMGVIMLSAISYVTLSTGERPFRSINRHINPVLGWGWLIATMLANMIWCMPQFSLCYAALEKNLVGDETLVSLPGAYELGTAMSVSGPETDVSSEADGDVTDPAAPEGGGAIEPFSAAAAERKAEVSALGAKVIISVLLLFAAGAAVFLNGKAGGAAKLFDYFLKGLVGVVVICFVGVVGLLASKGAIDWNAVLNGFIPDLSQWNRPTGRIAELISAMSAEHQEFWSTRVVAAQRKIMIGAAATAVGINMTFLMPYSMLRRGWDSSFRGLARFDLATGMAIPYVLVTTCVVIAAASQFHAKADQKFLSEDPAVMRQSALFEGDAGKALAARMGFEGAMNDLADTQVSKLAALSAEEKTVAASLQKRQAFDLARSIAPLLGEARAQWAFGIGIFGMGFSTIIILMLINGFVFCEILNKPLGGATQFAGCIVAGISGALWWFFWQGDSKVYLAIVTSNFGMMLLPIAYVTFFMMMNSRRILGDAKPTGVRAVVWNTLMGVSVIGAFVAAGSAVQNAMTDPKTGVVVITIAACFFVAVLCGFVHNNQYDNDQPA